MSVAVFAWIFVDDILRSQVTQAVIKINLLSDIWGFYSLIVHHNLTNKAVVGRWDLNTLGQFVDSNMG